jgi:hypothetical protein
VILPPLVFIPWVGYQFFSAKERARLKMFESFKNDQVLLAQKCNNINILVDFQARKCFLSNLMNKRKLKEKGYKKKEKRQKKEVKEAEEISRKRKGRKEKRKGMGERKIGE